MVSRVGERLGVVATADVRAEIWLAWVGDHARDVDDFSRRYLSSAECERLESYRSRAAAERYVVTRSLVRTVLGAHTGVAPKELAVRLTPTGKPEAEGVHFNVTHSGEIILLAVCDDRPVGVDVERRREVLRVQALIDRWLTTQERDELHALRARGLDDSHAFLRVWSLKEARLKALGVGISGAGGAELIRVAAQGLDELLEPIGRDASGYVGAVAFA
jgi:4'-phosphopantetheinyl transferase